MQSKAKGQQMMQQNLIKESCNDPHTTYRQITSNIKTNCKMIQRFYEMSSKVLWNEIQFLNNTEYKYSKKYTPKNKQMRSISCIFEARNIESHELRITVNVLLNVCQPNNNSSKKRDEKIHIFNFPYLPLVSAM